VTGFTKPGFMVCLYDNIDCVAASESDIAWFTRGSPNLNTASGTCGVGLGGEVPGPGRSDMRSMRVIETGSDSCVHPDGYWGVTWHSDVSFFPCSLSTIGRV
jgi:hypothetical protein